jgi:hypothetical protein
MALMLTLYMQQVLGYSPIKTGVAYLAFAGTAIIWANVAAQVVNRIGVKPALTFGMSMLTSGLLYFTQVSHAGLPRRVLLGRPLPRVLHPRRRDPLIVRADHDRRARGNEARAGRSGIGPDQHRAADRRRARDRAPLDHRRLDHGRRARERNRPACRPHRRFVNAFWAGAAIAFAGVLVSIFLVRGRDLRLPGQVVPTPALEEAA